MAETEGAHVISALELFDHGYWLHNFQDCMGVMLIDGLPPNILEIDDPKTPLRRPAVPNAAATKKPGGRDRKRLRKGLPPRQRA
jgi:hypothetical protein